MTPEEDDRRNKLIEGLQEALGKLPPDARQKIVDQLASELHENARRYAWLHVLDIPVKVRDDEDNLGNMAMLDTGIEAGLDAMMRALASKEPIPTMAAVPSYRKKVLQRVDQELKTDPEAKSRYDAIADRYGLHHPETTIEDL